MNFIYRFDDVLDEAKLKGSLERLLEIGEWRQLGARIRLRVRDPRRVSVSGPESSVDLVYRPMDTSSTTSQPSTTQGDLVSSGRRKHST